MWHVAGMHSSCVACALPGYTLGGVCWSCYSIAFGHKYIYQYCYIPAAHMQNFHTQLEHEYCSSGQLSIACCAASAFAMHESRQPAGEDATGSNGDQIAVKHALAIKETRSLKARRAAVTHIHEQHVSTPS